MRVCDAQSWEPLEHAAEDHAEIARQVSAGMPTSHGSQYFGIRAFPIMSHG